MPSQYQHLIDETKLIVDGYSTPDRLSHESDLPTQDEPSSGHPPHISPRTSPADLSIAGLFAQYDFQASDAPESPPSGDYYHASPGGSKRLASVPESLIGDEQPYNYPFLLGQEISEDENSSVLPVTDGEKLRLISAFIRETGTWCETTDSQMHFTVIHEMVKSTPLSRPRCHSLLARWMQFKCVRAQSHWSCINIPFSCFFARILLEPTHASWLHALFCVCTK